MAHGFVVTVMCIIVELVAAHTLGPLIFGLNTYPDWAAASHIFNDSDRGLQEDV